jgi:hypothetical protein
MEDDGLTVGDVEAAVLTGRIAERQKDRETGEWKYRIEGRGTDGREVELVGKMGASGKMVIITVYAP